VEIEASWRRHRGGLARVCSFFFFSSLFSLISSWFPRLFSPKQQRVLSF